MLQGLTAIGASWHAAKAVHPGFIAFNVCHWPLVTSVIVWVLLREFLTEWHETTDAGFIITARLLAMVIDVIVWIIIHFLRVCLAKDVDVIAGVVAGGSSISTVKLPRTTVIGV